jgi:hypothetical protein
MIEISFRLHFFHERNAHHTDTKLLCYFSVPLVISVYVVTKCNYVTARNRVLLENVTGEQVVTKFAAFYETVSCITVCLKALLPIPIFRQMKPVHTPIPSQLR